MKGKHIKRGPITFARHASGALIGAAAVGVIAVTVQAGPGSSEPVAAAETAAQVRAPEVVTVAARKMGPRARVIARAKTWHPHSRNRVPYSQSRTHGGYRTDCSGYASMTLGLGRPGQTTVGLASSRYGSRIKMSQLKTGDLVIDAKGSNTTRHVVIFEKWSNSRHASYWAYEQRGHYGTDHRTRSYGLSSGSEYKAYRPKVLR